MLLAYETLQFSIDTAVMFTIVALCVSSICLPTMPPTLTMFSSMFFKDKHKDMEPSRIPNLVCFSLIFSLSLMAAIGLAIRAAYGNGFCEEFISTSSGECREAGFAVAMSWTSVIVGGLTYHSQPVHTSFLSACLAIAGILVSWLDKHSGTTEATKAYILRRPIRELELLKQQSPRKPTDTSPRIHVPRPVAPYVASGPRGPQNTQGFIQLAPARTLRRSSQRIPSIRVPSSPLPSILTRISNNQGSLMLNREVKGPIGPGPRSLLSSIQTDHSQTLLHNAHPMKSKKQEAGKNEVWKLKYLSEHV